MPGMEFGESLLDVEEDLTLGGGAYQILSKQPGRKEAELPPLIGWPLAQALRKKKPSVQISSVIMSEGAIPLNTGQTISPYAAIPSVSCMCGQVGHIW